MKTAFANLFESKKFWTTVIGIVVTMFGAWLAKHGFDMSDEHVEKVAEVITLFFTMLLGGQALADHGKEKAKIEQQNVQIDPPGQAGFARLETFVGVLLFGVAVALIATACGAFKRDAKHAGGTFVDCMKPDVAPAAHELGSVLLKSVPAVLSDTGKVDRAGFKSLTSGLESDAAGCAIAAVVAELSKPRGTDTQASPLAVDALDLQSAWSDVDREQFGGRTFQVK